MIYEPKQHHRMAIDWILDHPRCGIFFDMSLGKTGATLMAAQVLRSLAMGANRVLIIAPKNVAKLVWPSEISKWQQTRELKVAVALGTPKQRISALRSAADVVCINRENVTWMIRELDGELPFDLVVIDESSSFKNHDSKRFKSLRGAIQKVPRVILLTGTPAPRNYENLWSQLFLLDGGERLGKNITTFRARYMMQNFSGFGYQLRAGAKAVIDERISDLCLSFRGEDFADMPPISYEDVVFELPEKVQASYKDFERDRVAELESGDTIVALSAASIFGKLLQYTNGAVYKEDENGNRVFEEIHDAKIQELKRLIEAANGQNVVVAYTFRHDIERIKHALSEYSPRELKSEQDYADWNAGKIRVLLGHPASMGHGLNLQQGGHIAIWFGLPLDLELYLQFNARLPRPGQEHPVVIHHLIARKTADERAYALLKSKNVTQKSLMEALSALKRESFE